MNFFGVGLPEMLVIVTVALLVFGPRKLPEISRTIARTVKNLQQASRDFEAEINREVMSTETPDHSPQSIEIENIPANLALEPDDEGLAGIAEPLTEIEGVGIPAELSEAVTTDEAAENSSVAAVEVV